MNNEKDKQIDAPEHMGRTTRLVKTAIAVFGGLVLFPIVGFLLLEIIKALFR